MGRLAPDFDPDQPPGSAPVDHVTRGKQIALRLLGAHGWSVAAMRARLIRRGIPQDAAETVIDELKQARLLSDAAFADETARLEAGRKPASDEFLTQRIVAKGIAERTAARATARATEGRSELDRAKDLAVRSKRTNLDPVAARRRLLGALMRRGFDAEIAAAAADHALGEFREPEPPPPDETDHPETSHDDL